MTAIGAQLLRTALWVGVWYALVEIDKRRRASMAEDT
jgi:hypothetical protein